MAPALVLNEDDKRIRFKKLHQKKKEDLINFRSLGVENQIFYEQIDEKVIGEYSEDDEDEDNNNQAQNYTQAYLTIQQYREEYLRKMRATVLEETSKDSLDETMAIKTETPLSPNHSEIVKENAEQFEIHKHRTDSKSETNDLLKNHYRVKVDTNQRFRQLLELSHQAAIYAKLKDTDFPLIVQHGLPTSVMPKIKNETDEADFISSEEEKEIMTDDSDERAVTSKHVYLQTRKPEQVRVERPDKTENKYNHKKFRTSQELDQITIGVLLNRKRKSVIVQGPNCKRSCQQFNKI